jgi:hypothetical protein
MPYSNRAGSRAWPTAPSGGWSSDPDRALVLDFDHYGRSAGLEILSSADSALPPALPDDDNTQLSGDVDDQGGGDTRLRIAVHARKSSSKCQQYVRATGWPGDGALGTALATGVDELDVPRPFAAILGLLSDRTDAIWRDRVGRAIATSEPGLNFESERVFRVAETMLELLEERCMEGSVTLAIEDLHWADRATVGVIAQVARGIEALPVVLIVSARPQPRSRELDRLLALLHSLGATGCRWGRSPRQRAPSWWRISWARAPGRAC